MLLLYGMPGACSLASHIALVWADVPFELRLLSHEAAHDPQFTQLNPKGAVPVLVDNAGEVITESLAVLQYIALLNEDADLGARAGDVLANARLNECLAELVSDVHKAWAPVFVPDRFVIEAAHEEEARQAAFRQLDHVYRRLDAQMAHLAADTSSGAGPAWRLFGRRTVADAYLYVMCRWKDNSPIPLAAYPSLAAFKARLDADEGVMQALRTEAAEPNQKAQN